MTKICGIRALDRFSPLHAGHSTIVCLFACYRGSGRIREKCRMPYQTIEVTKLTPHIGAEIGGVDLSRPLGNQQFQEVHDALMENLVIFFRDQRLTHDQHKAFGRLFGELAIHAASPHAPDGHPEILTIHADENSKHVAGEGGIPTCLAMPSRRWAASSI